jgi:putative transposase
VEALIASAIKEVYLRPERPPLMELWRAVGRQCLTRGLKTPAYRTVAARVRQYDARAVVQARAGAAAARQRYGPVKASSLQPGWPLEVVQIDHTRLDVLVVDEVERQPLGRRPWLTLAIDVASRVVTGFHVAFEPPSSLTVALALTQAVLPKGGWLERAATGLELAGGGLARGAAPGQRRGIQGRSARARGARIRGAAAVPAAGPAAFWGPHRAADRHDDGGGAPVAGHDFF